MRMKKIFSLFVACALVMSAAAVPFTQPVEKSQAASRVRIDVENARQHRNLTNAQPAKFTKGAVKPAAPARLKEAAKNIEKGHKPFFSNAKISAAKQDLSFSNVAMATASYYEGWEIDLYSADTAWIGYLIYDGGDETHLVASGLQIGSSNIVGFINGQDTIEAVDGSFSVAFDHVANGVPFYHVTGSELNAENDAIVLDITFPVVYAVDYEKYYYSQVYPEYCGLYFDCDYEIELEDAPIVVTGDTVFVTINNLEFKDKVATSGWWQLSGCDADTTLYVTFSNDNEIDEAEGVYDYVEDMDKTYTALYEVIDWEEEEFNQIKFAEGTILLMVDDSTGVATLYAEMLAKSGDVYIFDLTSKAKTISNNQITMVYANGVIDITTTTNDPYFFIFESKDDYDSYQSDFSQASVNAEVDDWISTASYYGALTALTFTGNQSIDVAEFSDNIFGSDLEDGEYVALASGIDGDERNSDAVYELFDYSAPAIVPTGDTVHVAIDNLAYSDYVASSGWWMIKGYNADSTIYVTFSNNSTDQAAGVYDYAEDMDKDFTYIAFIDWVAQTSEKVKFNSGTFTLSFAADSTAQLTGMALGKDGVVYDFDLSAGTAGGGQTIDPIEYDEEDADFNVDFTEYAEDDSDLAQYGLIAIDAEDADGNVVYLYLVANEGDSTLMPGEYPVTSTWYDEVATGGTALAGMLYNGYLYPCFAGITSSEGITNVWFIVAGKITVNADYSIDIDALNSYGRTITSHMTGRETAVEEVKVESVATKRIENGTLLIERNGALYDAQGIRR